MRVLVVDNNVELCRVLTEFFDSQPDMESVGEAYDGEQALTKIKTLSPDVVILDITMPHLDGVGVVERLNSMKLDTKPRIIVLTAFGKDDLITRLTRLGVDYFVIKPFNLTMLADRVRQFTKNFISTGERSAGNHEQSFDSTPLVNQDRSDSLLPGKNNREQRVVKLLHEMGIPPHFKGFTYLRDAVILCENDGYVGGVLTKELYPALATKYKTTVGGVEAAIRNAVIAAWDNGNTDFIRQLCGTHRGNRVPTNSLIIAKLAEEPH